MAQKHQRSNREAKKPKQNKSKIVVSTSPFASPGNMPHGFFNPAKHVAAKKSK